jgi:hypothetical protein
VEVHVDADRIAADLRGHGLEWLPFTDIRRIERFGDVRAVIFDRDSIVIPVALLDEAVLARMRARMTPPA